MMEQYCICCKSITKWLVVCKLPKYIFSDEYFIYSCKQCGLGRTEPEPVASIEYYEDNERNTNLYVDKYDLYMGFSKNLLKSLIRIVNIKGKSILDIGCGGGFLVEAANELGAKAKGLEANQEVVQWCKKRGLDVTNEDTRTLINSNKKYDIIILSAILEHLKNPIDLLEDAKHLLPDKGYVFISQACYRGLLPRMLPMAWYGWQPKEHYWHFTPESLTMLAEKIGYDVLLVHKNTLYHPWFFRGDIKTLVGRNLAAILSRVGVLLNMGDSFDMVLQKKH